MKLQFLGAANEVTGSLMLLSGQQNILVDCGLFQGDEETEAKNQNKFPFVPASIDAVFLTHGHLDHCGRLPKLVKEGFRGPIFATAPTIALSRLVLEDAADLMREELERGGQSGIYTREDVENTVALFFEINYGQERSLNTLSFTFHDAGHILGSSFVEIEMEGQWLVFSGDLGNQPSPILMPLEECPKTDILIMESTYGGIEHDDRQSRTDVVHSAVDYIVETGGTLVIPAFAVERTQELLYVLEVLEEHHKIAEVPVYLDSPLAIDVTSVFRAFPDYLRPAVANEIIDGQDLFEMRKLKMVRTANGSKELNNLAGPKIIIAGSGMMNGGRVQYHLLHHLQRETDLLLVVGFQAPGTLGRKIIDGAKRVHIKGMDIDVRAKIVSALSFSSHADNAQLLNWAQTAGMPKQVFCVHGELERLLALKRNLSNVLNLSPIIPRPGEEFRIL